MPHELPNNLRLRKLGNIRKVSKFHKMIAVSSLLAKMKMLLIVANKVMKNSD